MALGSAGLLAAMVGAPVASAAAEPAAAEWVATARGGAADVRITTTGGFIVDRIDPGGAVAISHIETATDQSASLASAPYPSEVGEQGPGLVYGLLQNTLPYNGVPFPSLPVAPSWPWTVRSSGNGSDPPKASLGEATSPFRLQSSAGAREAAAGADAGGVQPGAFALMHLQAKSSVNATEAGKAALSAASSIENLVIGDAVRVGEVRTELELTRAAGGEPQAVVKRHITGLSIGGVAAEIRPEGLFFQGTETPLPAPLLEGLRSAGIELMVGGVEQVTGGVQAKGLTVRMPFNFSGMGSDQLPISTPRTMTVELSFGTVLGTIEQIGDSRPFEHTATPAGPATGAAPVSGAVAPVRVIRPGRAGTSPAAATLATAKAGRPASSGRPAYPAPLAAWPPSSVTERFGADEGFVPAGDGATASGVAAPAVTEAAPVQFAPAALTSPGGFAGPEARREMGRIGWIAQGAAVAFVVLMVAGRARRVVGAK